MADPGWSTRRPHASCRSAASPSRAPALSTWRRAAGFSRSTRFVSTARSGASLKGWATPDLVRRNAAGETAPLRGVCAPQPVHALVKTCEIHAFGERPMTINRRGGRTRRGLACQSSDRGIHASSWRQPSAASLCWRSSFGAGTGRGRFHQHAGQDDARPEGADARHLGRASRSLTLGEDFVYSDGEQDRKTWRFTRTAEGRYPGMREDVIGRPTSGRRATRSASATAQGEDPSGSATTSGSTTSAPDQPPRSAEHGGPVLPVLRRRQGRSCIRKVA